MFQSTPPMQGATVLHHHGPDVHKVSIHAPYAGSDGSKGGYKLSEYDVSIHAPYAGSDCAEPDFPEAFSGFQSTPPMQGATVSCQPLFLGRRCFNPRPLCRERHDIAVK